VVGLCFTLVPVERVRTPLSMRAHDDAPTRLTLAAGPRIGE
jgi:hypothetical protein